MEIVQGGYTAAVTRLEEQLAILKALEAQKTEIK